MLPFILAQTLQMCYLIVCLARCIATAYWGVCGTHSQGSNHSGSFSVAQILAGLQLSNLLNEERNRPSHGCISDTFFSNKDLRDEFVMSILDWRKIYGSFIEVQVVHLFLRFWFQTELWYLNFCKFIHL